MYISSSKHHNRIYIKSNKNHLYFQAAQGSIFSQTRGPDLRPRSITNQATTQNPLTYTQNTPIPHCRKPATVQVRAGRCLFSFGTSESRGGAAKARPRAPARCPHAQLRLRTTATSSNSKRAKNSKIPIISPLPHRLPRAGSHHPRRAPATRRRLQLPSAGPTQPIRRVANGNGPGRTHTERKPPGPRP